MTDMQLAPTAARPELQLPLQAQQPPPQQLSAAVDVKAMVDRHKRDVEAVQAELTKLRADLSAQSTKTRRVTRGVAHRLFAWYPMRQVMATMIVDIVGAPLYKTQARSSKRQFI
mgnify:CR=1 FL=1